MTTLLLTLIICGGLFGALVYSGKVSRPAWAQVGGITPTGHDIRHGIRVERGMVDRARVNRCRPARRWHQTVWELPRPRRYLTWVQGEKLEERRRQSICNRERRVIELVFRGRAWSALRVAECESHLYRYAVGAAGERGVWQVHPQHFGYVDEARLWNPLYSTELAWRWSDHGTNFSPTWTCAMRLGIP